MTLLSGKDGRPFYWYKACKVCPDTGRTSHVEGGRSAMTPLDLLDELTQQFETNGWVVQRMQIFELLDGGELGKELCSSTRGVSMRHPTTPARQPQQLPKRQEPEGWKELYSLHSIGKVVNPITAKEYGGKK